MAASWPFEARVRLHGDRDAAARHIPRGRQLLGELMERVANSGFAPLSLRRTEAEVTFVCLWDGTLAVLDITAVSSLVVEAVATAAVLWIPRGFVFYPSSEESLFGWGLPAASADAYSAKALAPGLDTTLWTPGGALGQVLLTRYDIGYPDRRTEYAVPLLFTPETGPIPRPAYSSAAANNVWQAYRIEFCAFESPQTAPNNTAARRKIFELTNSARASNGRDPVQLPIRGFYSTAQTAASMMSAEQVVGHYYEGHWPQYRTPTDRGAKDGLPQLQGAETVEGQVVADTRDISRGIQENLLVSAASATVVQTGYGEPTYKFVGGYTPDPQAAFDAWMGSPGHRATILRDTWDHGEGFMDVGVLPGVAAQEFSSRSQWLHTGAGHWRSVHEEIPDVSWHSFATMNLAFETWPVVEGGAGLELQVPPVGVDGDFWLYYSVSTSSRKQRNVPALSSAIFMRGRIVAIAPHGALVLAAAVQKLEVGGIQKYRLVALTHLTSDQTGDPLIDGCTRYLHVWYADLGTEGGVAVHAGNTIRGVRGSPTNAYAWTDPDDKWGWVDGGTVDVAVSGKHGSTPDMLKYTSLWRFNDDATKAVALRDLGTPSEIQSAAANYAFAADAVHYGVNPYTLQLEIAAPDFSVVLTTPGYVSSVNLDMTVLPSWSAMPPLGSYYMQAAAVDFDAQGELVYAYRIWGFPSPVLSPSHLDYVGIGPKTALTPADLEYLTLVGASDTATQDERFGMMRMHVLDVNDGVFVVEGSQCRYAWDYAFGGTQSFNSAYVPNWTYTASDVYRIQVLRRGEVLQSHTAGNSDGLLYDYGNLGNSCAAYPGVDIDAFPFCANTSDRVQASYCVARTGEWALTVMDCPQPQFFQTLNAGIVVPTSGDGNRDGGPSWYDVYNSGCTVPLTPGTTNASRPLTFSDVSPRWGWITSSFAQTAELASMMQIPGANPRSFYVRLV